MILYVSIFLRSSVRVIFVSVAYGDLQVSFEVVRAELELPGQKQKNPRLSQVCSGFFCLWII